MSKRLIEIASEIVKAQVSSTLISTAEIASSLRKVFSTLQEIQQAEAGGIELAPVAEAADIALTEEKSMLTPADSIQNDKVVCLECGAEMKQLTSKHLVSHGMSQREYREKYGFSMSIPLAAKSVTKARSKAAKKRGLPEELQKFMEARRQSKAEASGQATTKTVSVGSNKPALTPQDSIQEDKVICLECGKEMRQLTTKHLVSHGMNQKEYRDKYGFSMKTPLAAKSLINARSKAAQKRGLPENLKQFIETRRKGKTEEDDSILTETDAGGKPKRTVLRKKKVV